MTIAAFRHRRLQRHVLALALPWLVLRLLLPAGFMPVVADGRAALDLCTAQGLQLAQPVGGPGSPDHPGGEAPGTRGHDAPCAFAASATAAPAPAPHTDAAPVVAAIPFDTTIPAAPGFVQPSILRAQSPRAPPFLS